jgi:hypothetical protein
MMRLVLLLLHTLLDLFATPLLMHGVTERPICRCPPVGSGALSMALENRGDGMDFAPVRTKNRSRSPR